MEQLIKEKVKTITLSVNDPAHDFSHIERTTKIAKQLIKEINKNHELVNKDPEIIIPAIWLHDIVNIPKMIQEDQLHLNYQLMLL